MRAEKLAARVNAPWRMAIILVSITAGASLATWLGNELPSLPTDGSCDTKYIHIKLAEPGLTSAEAFASWQAMPVVDALKTKSEPLFDLDPTVRDDRARWIRVQASCAELVEVEQGF